MARESRHLIVFGIPESTQEDGIKEAFDRFGPIEKVKLLPTGEEGEERSALVDFMDIKSAISAHDASVSICGDNVRTEYSETTLASLNRSRKKWQDRRSDVNEGGGRRGRPDFGHRPRMPSRDGAVGTIGMGGGGPAMGTAGPSGAKMNELRVLVVRNISDRHTERSLCEGLFHEFKKHGEVKQVNVHEENGTRLAVVEFKKAQEAETAMETVQNRTFFGCEMKISLASCSVLPGLRNERGFRGRGRRYHAFGGFGGGGFEGGFQGMAGPGSPGEEEVMSPEPNSSNNHRATAGRLQVTVEQDVSAELEEEFDVNATRTLFVGNIDKAVTPNDLRSVFSRFGEILEVDMKSQRSGMYAFVQFNDMTSACRAKALMNAQLIGRSYCKVGFGHRVVTHTLWIGGISLHVSDADVARKCSRFGTVLEVAVNPAQKAALVHFDSKDSAVTAADELRGKIFHGSRLKVDFANRNSRSAFYKQLEEQGGDIGPMRGGPDPMGMPGGPGGRGGGPGAHGDMFFGDMPHGPPATRRGGFRPDFHRGFVGGRGAPPGRGGNGPMFRNGPGGRGLFTRHFRGNMNEDEDYDRELRNFGYMRERERQRQRVWQQGDEADGDGDGGASDSVATSHANGSDDVHHSAQSQQSDMSDENGDVECDGVMDSRSGERWPELKTAHVKKEDGSGTKRSVDSNNTGGKRVVGDSKKRSEPKSADASKSKSQDSSRDRHEASSPHAETLDEGSTDAARESSYSSTTAASGSPGVGRPSTQSHGEASNSTQSSKRDRSDSTSRHHQAHRDKESFAESSNNSSSKSRRSTTTSGDTERRRRRDDNDRGVTRDSSHSLSHSSGKSTSASATCSLRQQARSRSRSPLSRSHASRRPRHSPGQGDIAATTRSPTSRGKSHDDSWSKRRDSQYSQHSQNSPPSHRSVWRHRHTTTDSNNRSSSHTGPHSPGYSPSQQATSSDQQQQQLVANEVAVASATAMYTVSMSGGAGSYVVPQSSATFLYDANNQALAVQGSAATDAQNKQAVAAATAGNTAGFVTSDIFVPATGAVGNQVMTLGLSSTVASQTNPMAVAGIPSVSSAAPSSMMAIAAVATGAGAVGGVATAAPLVQQPDDLLGLLQRYPVMWQGHLALKNDAAAVQMHFLSGSQQLAQLALPQPSASSVAATLRIAQRMRLDPSQLEGVALRMQAESEHCLLLALPCGRDPLDVHAQTRALRTGFITYLQSKQAAGIINVIGNAPAQVGGGFVLHIFPPCDFTERHVARVAPDLLSSAADSGHLMVVIAAM